MKTISSSMIYKGLYKDLEARFGYDETHRIWALAERVNRHLYEKYSADDKYGNADMLFPAAAVYLALHKRQPNFPAMDKVYMTGFRHIQYRRTKSVAEGDECCDYRLWWDRKKK